MAIRIDDGGGLGSYASQRGGNLLARRELRRSATMVIPWVPGGPKSFPDKISIKSRWPTLPTTCGDGLYPCNQAQGVTTAGLDGLGGFGFGGLGTIGCAELDTAVTRLGVALRSAEALGATASGNYQAAKAFYDDESSLWNGHVVATGEVCKNLVDECNRLISSLGGTVPGTNPTLDPGASATDWLGTAKTVAIAAAVIAGALVLIPVIREVVVTHALTRKVRR